MRRLQSKAARAALVPAGHFARQAGIFSLTTEVEGTVRSLDTPAARLIARSVERPDLREPAGAGDRELDGHGAGEDRRGAAGGDYGAVRGGGGGREAAGDVAERAEEAEGKMNCGVGVNLGSSPFRDTNVAHSALLWRGVLADYIAPVATPFTSRRDMGAKAIRAGGHHCSTAYPSPPNSSGNR